MFSNFPWIWYNLIERGDSSAHLSLYGAAQEVKVQGGGGDLTKLAEHALQFLLGGLPRLIQAYPLFSHLEHLVLFGIAGVFILHHFADEVSDDRLTGLLHAVLLQQVRRKRLVLRVPIQQNQSVLHSEIIQHLQPKFKLEIF
jgi:hypothetical protein